MAWTSPRTWVAGEVLTASLLNTHVRDNLKAIGDAWTAYTPTLTGFTVSASQAYYRAAGKHITVSYVGTLNAAATAEMSVSLPVAAARTPIGFLPVGVVHALDSGTIRRSGVATLSDADGTLRFFIDNSATAWNATGPFTWASGDQIAFTITYEGA